MELNVDRVIKSCLDALDLRPYNDPELCTDLGELYNASKRPHIGMAFLMLVARRSPRAAEWCRRFNAAGSINLPELFPHPKVALTAEVPGVLCTAANARFFPILLNLIGSVQHSSWRSVRKIVVCDLGLFRNQAEFLSKLERVELVCSTWPVSFQAWKFPFIFETLYREPGPLLYLDAGCYVERDLEDLFKIIEKQDYLFFFNAPYEDPMHRTRNWTSRCVYEYFGIPKEGDSTVTAISTLLGTSGRMKEWMVRLVDHNDLFLLRPHSDLIDNRYDQSLFSVFVQHVEKMHLTRFEEYLRNAAGYGAPNSWITIHRSKFQPGEAYGFLRSRAAEISVVPPGAALGIAASNLQSFA
jgi:hypothetical protein